MHIIDYYELKGPKGLVPCYMMIFVMGCQKVIYFFRGRFLTNSTFLFHFTSNSNLNSQTAMVGDKVQISGILAQ